MEPTDTDVPDPSDCGTPLITKNGLRLYPVPIGDSGDGLPYAPADWPNPGDIWRWKTGKRLKTNGYFKDRYLYPPKHLLKRDILPRKYPFASKPSLEEYLQSMFPGADINSFFDSFSWEIPSQQLSNKIENSDSDPLLGSVGCKAGNTTCSSLVESGNTPSEFMSCNICCSEQGFCRYCCCILCCKIASSGYGGFCYIRCEQRIDEGYICGHIAHIDCGLRAYMAGTVGGSIGLDAEYYCRRCDSRTDLVQHVMKLVDISQTINSEDKMEKVLNVCICLLRNSHRASAQQLFDNIQAAIVKLKSGTKLEDIWSLVNVPLATEGVSNMSSDPVELSSGNSSSRNYTRNTPANQRLVDESQTATSTGTNAREGTKAASMSPPVAQASLIPKKKKRNLIKGVKFPITSEATPTVPTSTAKDKDKEGELPKMLRNSLPVKLNYSHLPYLRQYFSIPHTVEMRLPSCSDQVYWPLVVWGDEVGPLSPGWTSMYVEDFTYGARFPLSPFTNKLLLALKRAPGQLHPLGWLYLTAFHVICGLVKVEPNMPMFCQLFTVQHKGWTTSLSPAKKWNIFMDGKPGKVFETRWHALWFYVKGGMDSRIPKAWIEGNRADRPRAEPDKNTIDTLKKLRTFWRKKLHWKIFCEEGVMMAANLIPDHGFNTSANPIPRGIY